MLSLTKLYADESNTMRMNTTTFLPVSLLLVTENNVSYNMQLLLLISCLPFVSELPDGVLSLLTVNLQENKPIIQIRYLQVTNFVVCFTNFTYHVLKSRMRH